MGIITLIILLGIEVVFLGRSILSKCNHREVKSVVRMAELIVLGVLLSIGVFEWGFRYYFILAVLIVESLIGLVVLLKKREKPYKLGKSIFLFMNNGLIFTLALSLAIVFPQYEKPAMTGEYEIATETYTWVDQNRVETYTNTGENRLINVAFWYPKDSGNQYPLVVFSHGAYGIKSCNTSTYEELASNGYVVCAIDHPYHSLYTKSQEGKVAIINQDYMKCIINENTGVYDEATGIRIMRDITKLRVADMNFAIDTILAQIKSRNPDPVFQSVDGEKIGVFGHSLGGAAAVELGRERRDIGAVINLDGDMSCEYLGYENEKPLINKAIYPKPLLNIWTDTMVSAMERADHSIVYPHEYIADTAPIEYDIHLSGTNHMSLTDLSLVSPVLVKLIMSSVSSEGNMEQEPLGVINRMNKIILEFFDCYLKKRETSQFAKGY